MALVNHAAGDEMTPIFHGDFPLMATRARSSSTAPSAWWSALIRSPGVYFAAEEDRTTGRLLSTAKLILIAARGWSSRRKSDYLAIKFNRKRTIPVTILLRALAAVHDGFDAIADPGRHRRRTLAVYKEVDNNPDHRYLEGTIRMEPQWDCATT